MSNKKDIPEKIACPRQLFVHDLKITINKKIDEGHQLIISGDFNSEYIQLTDWIMDLGLKDIIHNKHGTSTRTCKRSKNFPIDCILGNATLQKKKGGLLSFHRLCSDHRGIWVDIPTDIIFGYKPPQLTQFNARRLKINNPRVVVKYLTYIHSTFRENNLFHRMNESHSKPFYLFPEYRIEQYG